MINNPALFLANLWDWNVLTGTTDKECRQLPTDLDGMLERNNQFLLIETKSPIVRELPTGQRISFESMIRTGYFTVLIVYGERNSPERIEVWTKSEIRKYTKADLDLLRQIVTQWYQYADKKSKPRKLVLPIRLMT